MNSKQNFFATSQFSLGMTVSSVHCSLKKLYGKCAVSRRTVQRWRTRTEREKEIKPKKHPGRQLSLKTRSLVVMAMKKGDRTTRQISRKTRTSQSTVYRTLKRIGCKFSQPKFVPHILSKIEKRNELNIQEI